MISTEEDLMRHGNQLRNIHPLGDSKSELLCEVPIDGYSSIQVGILRVRNNWAGGSSWVTGLMQ